MVPLLTDDEPFVLYELLYTRLVGNMPTFSYL